MSLALYGHPFSSYTQKVLIALYENATPFAFKLVGPEAPENHQALRARWPLAKFPLLDDGGTSVFESSAIIEHLDMRHGGPVRLVPADAAVEVRMLDRVFDNYVMTPTSWMVLDALRAPETRAPQTIVEARALLDQSYRWLDRRMADRTWATGDRFTLADCAAAPSLFYADWAYPIADALVHLRAYRQRLLARPSFARAVDEARPYRGYFPLGAPDRD